MAKKPAAKKPAPPTRRTGTAVLEEGGPRKLIEFDPSTLQALELLGRDSMKDLQELAGYMRQHYVEAGDWWENQGIPGLQDKALPDDLVDDFKQMAAAEEAEA